MGYSIGVHTKNVKSRKKMLDFMAKEYHPHWKIRGFETGISYSTIPIDSPSYCNGANLIGIDYNASGFERGYIFTLVRWMALQVGKKQRKFKLDTNHIFEDPVTYILYDDEKWPIIRQSPSKTEEKLKWACVDRWAMGSDLDDFVHEIHPDEFLKAQEEACRKNGIDPYNWPKPSDMPEGITWKIRDTRMAILKPSLIKAIKPIRKEIERLDREWRKYN